MTEGLHLSPRHREKIEALVREYLPDVEAWVYGSRVNGRSHDGSDLDLVLRGPKLAEIDASRLAEFTEALQDSTIPFLVEARDWARLPEQFHSEVERHHVVLVAGNWKSVPNGVEKEYVVAEGEAQKSRGVGGQWCERRWGDLATLEYGRALRGHNMGTGQIRVFGTNGPIGWHDRALCPHPSVIIGRKGACRGVHYSPQPFYVIDTAFYLKTKAEVDVRWAYYTLLTQDINGLDSGSAIPSTSRKDFYALPVSVPPRTEQRGIAHILGTLDDKTELNRRMNETLEEMARALFKSWFVDFDPVHAKSTLRHKHAAATSSRGGSNWTVERARTYLERMAPNIAALFPDSFVDSELGPIPEGWEVKRIEDIAERVAMGPFGSSIKVSTFVDEGIPIISGQHLKGVLLTDNEYRFITEEHANKLEKANVRRGDVIFTHAGSIGQVACIPETSMFERYVISQRQFYMRCDVSRISPLFVVHFFKTPEGRHQLLANTSSTGVPSISRPVTYLRSIKLCIPSNALWNRFNEIVAASHLKAGWNTTECRSLTALRDTLLPKLVSRELRVSGLETK